eukprot:637-Heterococcus_DN1.PRE.1
MATNLSNITPSKLTQSKSSAHVVLLVQCHIIDWRNNVAMTEQKRVQSSCRTYSIALSAPHPAALCCCNVSQLSHDESQQHKLSPTALSPTDCNARSENRHHTATAATTTPITATAAAIA